MLFRTGLLIVTTLLSLTGVLRADDYPTRPVRFVVGFSAGGATDIVARLLAQKLSEQWKQPVVVENRLGASGTIAADVVAKSVPDGYTMMVSSPTNTAAATGMFSHLPYDVVKDFIAVSVIATTPFFLVVPETSPVKTIGEFLQYIKKDPASVTYGSAGLGAQGHLAAELLNQSLGIKMTHVPYKGESAGITDLVAGRLSFMFLTLSVAKPLIQSKQLRGLAVSSLQRSEFAMEYPTVAESGIPGFEIESWNALYVPSALPRDLVVRLNADVVNAIHTPDALERFKQQDMRVVGNSSADATAYLRAETEKWGAVIKKANFRQEQ
jgi:tripartite-type tricarboxylate transporter receptor subunit TctC